MLLFMSVNKYYSRKRRLRPWDPLYCYINRKSEQKVINVTYSSFLYRHYKIVNIALQFIIILGRFNYIYIKS